MVIVCLCCNGLLPAIILHPGYEPDLPQWIDRPTDAWCGRFATNASCVVVGGDFVLTTRHQCGGTSSTIVVAGQSYTVRRIFLPPDNPDGTMPDLRLVQLKNGSFLTWADLYRKRKESGKQIIMGGYGKNRGTALVATGTTTVYGYTWNSVSNSTLRWCTNKIETTKNDSATGSTCGFNWKSDELTADFDDPTLSSGGATTYEGAVAEYDSGGGWFIFDDGLWKVAGLSNATERLGQSVFRDATNPTQADPDLLYAVRVSSYIDWIDGVLNACGRPGDFNRDCLIDLADLVVLADYWLTSDCASLSTDCQGTDLTLDNQINLLDFVQFNLLYLSPH